MSAKISSSKHDVNINKTASIQETISIFNVDERKSFLKFCKQSSEVVFRSKNSQISDGSIKSGKSMLCVNNVTFHLHSVQIIT